MVAVLALIFIIFKLEGPAVDPTEPHDRRFTDLQDEQTEYITDEIDAPLKPEKNNRWVAWGVSGIAMMASVAKTAADILRNQE